jgi:DNA-directed RNA polymerase beta' subunit
MVKLAEDATVWQDSTVRNANGSIIQFQYGNNNYDPTNTVKIKNTMQCCDISRLANRLNLNYKN